MPFEPRPGHLKDDIAAASACYLHNVLPQLLKLSASELYDALRSHFLANLEAYDHERTRTKLEASKN